MEFEPSITILRQNATTVTEQGDCGESSDHSSETGSEAKCSNLVENGQHHKSGVVTIKFTKASQRQKVLSTKVDEDEQNHDDSDDEEDDEVEESDSDSQPPTNGEATPIEDEFDGFEDFSVNAAQHAADEMKRRLEEIDPCEKLRSLCKKGEVSELREFLKKRDETGVDIDYVSSDGWTCLHEIITHGCQFTSVARVLLEHGAK